MRKKVSYVWFRSFVSYWWNQAIQQRYDSVRCTRFRLNNKRWALLSKKQFLPISLRVAYSENFHGAGFHSVAYTGHLHLVCAVCDVTISRRIHVSKPTFRRSLLTYYAYSSTCTPLDLCVIALNINYQRSRLRYRRKINSTLRHSSS